jgi:diadenylate cyclase
VGIALVVVFQPELRRAITQLANYDFFVTTGEKRETLEMVADISQVLADKRYGALIAIERDMDLSEIAQTGVILEADLSMELALTIFHPKTALHDGGMILRNDRVEAAGCIYPVTQREFSDRSIGLRHRAAMGLAEEFDAVIICVSEETGNISLFHGGRMERALPHAVFKKRLTNLLLNTDGEDEEVEEEQTAGEDVSEQRPAAASTSGAATTTPAGAPAPRRATAKNPDSKADTTQDKASTHEPDKNTIQQLESKTDQPAGGDGSVVSSADKR